MKKILFVIAIMVSVAAFPVPSTAAEKAVSVTAQDRAQKEQYEKSMEERLRKLGKDLDDLKARAATMTKQATKEMNRHIAEAEKKQKAAIHKLEEMKKESQKKWDKFTDEMNAAADEFEKAYEKAKSQFKQ